jgi:hypothetical protein
LAVAALAEHAATVTRSDATSKGSGKTKLVAPLDGVRRTWSLRVSRENAAAHRCSKDRRSWRGRKTRRQPDESFPISRCPPDHFINGTERPSRVNG